MAVTWADLKIPDADFDIAALHSAMDARRTGRGMSWKAVAREVNRGRPFWYPPDQPVHNPRTEE